jgi:Uma2 family endonuclease
MNLQFWVAAVAYIPAADWVAFGPDEYQVYAPPVVIEVLSSANGRAKLNSHRIVAMSAGTQEFWVLDGEKRTVEVTTLNGCGRLTQVRRSL